MRLIRLIVFLSTMCWALPGLACNCGNFDLADAYERAEYIFVGVVESAWIERTPPEDYSFTFGAVVARVIVQETFKGAPTELDRIITMPDSRACGVPMAPNQTYLFFVHESFHEQIWLRQTTYGLVTICGGTLPDYDSDYDARIVELMEYSASAA